MPVPPNTGGHMGYAPGVDTGLVTPWAMQSDNRTNSIGTTGSAVLVANDTYLSHVTWQAFGTLYAFRYRCSVAGGSGHVDIGLYDQFGNLLTHTGITATSALANGTTVNLANTYGLRPAKFYMGFWIDNATDTIRQLSVNNGLALCSFGSTGAGGLPSSVTPPLASLGVEVCFDGLVTGGWS